MTTKEQILGFFVLWTAPERNSLRPFRGMTYRGEFVRGRGEAPEEEGEESVRRQPRGGAKRRRHGGAKRRRQEAARRGRRAARTREEVKYRKEGRQKRAERTGGQGRRCTGAEHECSWRGTRREVQKKSGGRVESSTTHLSVLHQPTGSLEPGAESAAGWRSRRLGPGAGCREQGQEAECRTPNAGAGGRVPNAERRVPGTGHRAPQAKTGT